eukprot:m.61016 g.61016  ORF g.61016 m.61016 type:complete len:144 (+) comp15744_c0_seq1:214-645(+)
MLRPRPLAQMLGQAASGGVKHAMLLKKDGSLIAYATGDKDGDSQVNAALASNVWSFYTTTKIDEENGDSHSVASNSDDDVFDDLETVMLECEEGKLLLTKVATILLCLISEDHVGFGMLKAKADALVLKLHEPLSKVDMMDND